VSQQIKAENQVGLGKLLIFKEVTVSRAGLEPATLTDKSQLIDSTKLQKRLKR
jgi:hypothetical protein